MTEAPRPLPVSNLLTTPEAAEYLRVSDRTLEAKRVDGTGPRYFKVGPGKASKVVYRIADLEEWLQKQQYGSTAEYKR
ncbi:helix-turn-helix domain-containing protein [Hyphomicrobium sp. CS1BSMeth3]|uniref:helix-turn-helix transcriptional regulator n=1 Tax=Hyphomicrobium sp. CS1BSMeth3 TaxID=1892844 RepID=UPI000930FCC7|nr:helix-turn-helix domain-containing protein [Hyphomicrobium sp. CS1BSMeth3]